MRKGWRVAVCRRDNRGFLFIATLSTCRRAGRGGAGCAGRCRARVGVGELPGARGSGPRAAPAPLERARCAAPHPVLAGVRSSRWGTGGACEKSTLVLHQVRSAGPAPRFQSQTLGKRVLESLSPGAIYRPPERLGPSSPPLSRFHWSLGAALQPSGLRVALTGSVWASSKLPLDASQSRGCKTPPGEVGTNMEGEPVFLNAILECFIYLNMHMQKACFPEINRIIKL